MRSHRLSPREARARSRRLRLGVGGTVVIAVVLLVTMQFSRLPLVGGGRELSAYFTEAGGLRTGAPVLVAGARVGEVDDISIEADQVRVDFTVTNDEVRLGKTTRAAITTLTLLGKAGLELEPDGSGDLDEDARIPASRTSSPYDITAALSELTDRSATIDVGQLSKALSTLTGTFAATPVELKSALDGLEKIAGTVDDNGDTLQALLDKARSLTDVLATRNTQVGTLLTSGSALLAELNARQRTIVDVLQSTTELTAQVSRLIEENDAQLKPALKALNSVTDLLNRNKTNLQKTIEGAYHYVIEYGDAISSGPYIDAYVQNLNSPGTLAPVLSGMFR
jgi:phospholipid/cholesterol/gamma-HCH transport system substrate-binding protein